MLQKCSNCSLFFGSMEATWYEVCTLLYKWGPIWNSYRSCMLFVPGLKFVSLRWFTGLFESISCLRLIWGLAGACKRLWSWSSYQARHGTTNLSGQQPTAFSLSDSSAKNPRFACGWIFQRRLEQEGVQLFTKALIFLRMNCRRLVENVSCNVLDTPLCLRRIRV